jgi:hypothetical protein
MDCKGAKHYALVIAGLSHTVICLQKISHPLFSPNWFVFNGFRTVSRVLPVYRQQKNRNQEHLLKTKVFPDFLPSRR